MAASSAVPVLFPPILIEKHEECDYQKPGWLTDAEFRAEQEDDQQLREIVAALNFYLDKNSPPYVTLLDGGVTDNLGLRTTLRNMRLSGGVKQVFNRAHIETLPKRLVLIVVNASTTSETSIGESRVLPSMGEVLTTVTDMQLHLYNTETSSLLKQELMRWADTISTDDHPVTPYFIELDVTDIEDLDEQLYFNKDPHQLFTGKGAGRRHDRYC